MFFHYHPYEPFLHETTKKVIVGTLPPPRFTTKELKPEDVDFCYGSKDSNLWLALCKIYNLDFNFDNSKNAVIQRKKFLKNKKIGICDIVESCKRVKIDASDLGMNDVILRDLVNFITVYKNIDSIIFTGGNTKNGPEYFFRQQLKKFDLKLELINTNPVKIHQVIIDKRVIKTYSLTSPSNAANRSIGANAYYKNQKKLNPKYTTFDFRFEQYQKVFEA